MRKFIAVAALAVAVYATAPAWAQSTPPVFKTQPSTSVSVTTSATALTTGVVGRTSVYVFNTDTVKTLYVSWGSSVTTANGWPVLPGQWIEFIDVTAGMVLYGVTTSTTLDARVMQAVPQ